LDDASIFSKIDLMSGHNQIKVKPDISSRQHSCFSFCSFTSCCILYLYVTYGIFLGFALIQC
ncbi:hypothetical protein K493DRAFT_220614, partial [Basidiobolus meristosporus CBS 931.73]